MFRFQQCYIFHQCISKFYQAIISFMSSGSVVTIFVIKAFTDGVLSNESKYGPPLQCMAVLSSQSSSGVAHKYCLAAKNAMKCCFRFDYKYFSEVGFGK